jgi:hypothetical protein
MMLLKTSVFYKKISRERNQGLLPGEALFVRGCFLQQVHLGDDHPSAAVPLRAQAVQDLLGGLLWFFTSGDCLLVRLAAFLVFLVQRGDHLSAGKTSDWDNHPSSPV